MIVFVSKGLSRSFHLALGALALLAGSWVQAADRLPDFADLVERNAEAIVEISAVQMVESQSFLSPQELEELLRRLNPGQERPEIPGENEPQMRERAALGSGFIISEDGYVVTNHHVVAGATDITVHLTDRREYAAEVIGLDEPSDLALLKISASDLPMVRFGDSDRVRVGEWVLAIGSPFGLEFSAAAGIVSAKGRSMPGPSSYNYMSFIQTDVAINQGNSGGPLFNLDGEVIGINSQILSSTGGSNGISFSIPSNVAVNVIDQLRDMGVVQRGLLGVLIRPVSFPLAQAFGMDRPRGAFVDDVQDGSPAAQAGLQVEDIVLEFDGRLIEDSADLPFYVGQHKPGTRSNLLVYRNGEELRLTVTLGSSPTNTLAETTPDPVQPLVNPLGITVVELSAEARQVAGVAGVRVVEVIDGPGAEAGIAEGDVIVALNRQEIRSVEDFNAIAAQLPPSGFVPVRILREGRGTTLALEMN
ncbi:MAG: hypothetical protein RLZZ385_1363 [Pseudomonadota bacterium]|jgi:serine protease Do